MKPKQNTSGVFQQSGEAMSIAAATITEGQENRKKSQLAIRTSGKKRNAIQARAVEKGISEAELITRYVELGLYLEKFFHEGKSNLILSHPKNWPHKEMGVPYDELINEEY